MKKFYMKSSAGKFLCYEWHPAYEPIGIIQIIHGIKEHVARYEALARYFTNAGFLVVGADHPGHGPAAEEPGYLAGGWSQAVKNIRSLYKRTHCVHKSLPYIMFGHSMGSFLLMTYLSVYHDDLSGAVISGTGWQPEAAVAAGRAMCKALSGKCDEHSRNKLLNTLIFGGYRRHFASEHSNSGWISSDIEVVKRYENDPLCTWTPTIQLCSQMLRGIQRNQMRSNLTKMQKHLPVFFISGQQDPVGNFGNGVLKTVQAFKDAGMNDVLVELYPAMRHECHNEIGKERVFDDILHWIQSKVFPVSEK